MVAQYKAKSKEPAGMPAVRAATAYSKAKAKEPAGCRRYEGGTSGTKSDAARADCEWRADRDA